MPYWQMRAVGFALAPGNFLAFNENFGHFMLRPQSMPTIARHMFWRARNFVVWELSPGGFIYTMLWRVRHPGALRRPWLAAMAGVAGRMVAVLKRSAQSEPPDPVDPALHEGISVVIPSRNGQELLERGLPEVVRQISRIGGEVIVSDNGSDDGTIGWLREHYPEVEIAHSGLPLSFASAVNLGIEVARFSHLCLLNNDMVVEDGFFEELLRAFKKVPDLFCATAQIFFPEGVRRQETGKAVMPPFETRPATDFPVTCDLPVEGEDLSYVLYGSGGCSLFDTAKLRQLNSLDPVYEPAYVEDLDLGVRGWQQGWPTVFAAGARVVHAHRATTARYYTPLQLDKILELNYLRFLARTITDPVTFLRCWRHATRRLNLLAAGQKPDLAALETLGQAWRAPVWCFKSEMARTVTRSMNEESILAIGSGAVAVFPGTAGQGRPVILIATPYLPFPLAHGGAVRMYNLMKRAAEHFDLVLASFVDALEPVPLELLEICAEVVTVKRFGSHLRRSTSRPDAVEEFDSPAFHAALRQTVRKWRPGVAQLEFTQMAQYAADCAPARTVLVEHDVTLDLHQQLLAQAEDWELRRQLDRWIPFETAAWRAVDCVVAMSEKDRALIGERAVALPNGVDTERFRPRELPGQDISEAGRLLFIGSFGHLPNLLAVDFFLREVWPLLDGQGFTLHIIAGARRDFFVEHYRDSVRVDFDRPGVEIEDFVADVRPAYQRAGLVIAPLLASAGTNVKILEAMAMGKAIVSTPGGVNGLDLQDGRDVVVAGTAEEMAAAIRGLRDDAERRRALERQARETAVARFDWDRVAHRQRDLYRRLTGQPIADRGAIPIDFAGAGVGDSSRRPWQGPA